MCVVYPAGFVATGRLFVVVADTTCVQVLDGGFLTVSGIALDWITKNIYWADFFLHRIEVVSTNGRFRTPLITENITNPHCIVLDPRQGYVVCVGPR